MSDPAENDNTNPDVDNLASLTTESHTIVCETELDEDFFVCRKCNKVFKDLSEYLEHKINDENYKLSQTKSKSSKRLFIPQLVERKKSLPKKAKATADVEQSSHSNDGTAPEESVKSDNHKEDEVGNSEGTSGKKRGRKRKSEIKVDEQQFLPLEKENNCNLCDRKFRRAATLRWHLKNDHKEKGDSSADSDSSMDGLKSAELDEDFNPRVVQENEGLKNDDGDDDDVDVRSVKRPTITVLSADPSRMQDSLKGDVGEDHRPYICDICGRGFKEIPAYKAHAIVHSTERNFMCTVEGCPYGFKTKGGLVRHMRRHTGERPFACERCGRAFAESGALSRHMRARRNCAQTPDAHYPRYKKKWTYHPNIEAVVDELQRDVSIASQEPMEASFFIHRESVQLAETGEQPEDLNSNSLVSVKTEIVAPAEVGTEEWSLSDESPVNPDHKLTVPSAASLASSSGLPEPRERTIELGGPVTRCQVCSKRFQHLEHLESHLRTHLADQPSHCGLCHFLAQNRDELRQHVLAMHTEFLNDIESTLPSLDHSDSTASSQQKDERIALREALQAIKQLHRLKTTSVSNDKPSHPPTNPSTTGSLQCMICNRTFKGVNYMRQHMRMHTGDRPYKCPRCNRSFTSKDVMKKHMYVHMNQRDYKCGECGKMFKRLVHVQQHIKTHSQERLFRCSVCEKLFKTHNSLKVHLRTHTNVNPYRCQVCNRHFRERGSLQRHMRLHTGERPYICPHCNRGFAEQGTLARHLKAKVPCSSTRDSAVQLGSPNNTMLAQFSSVVADTQYILPSVNNEDLTGGNLIVLKTANGESEEVIENIEIVTEDAALNDGLHTEALVANESIGQIMDETNSETIQVYDTTTGESLIITGDRTIIKSHQTALESMSGEVSLDKIRDILLAASEGQGLTVAMTSTDSLIGDEGEEETGGVVISEDMMVKLEDGSQEIAMVKLEDGSQEIAILDGNRIELTTVNASSGTTSQGDVHVAQFVEEVDDHNNMELSIDISQANANVADFGEAADVDKKELGVNTGTSSSSSSSSGQGNVEIQVAHLEVEAVDKINLVVDPSAETNQGNVEVEVTNMGVGAVNTIELSADSSTNTNQGDVQLSDLGVGAEVITVLSTQDDGTEL